MVDDNLHRALSIWAAANGVKLQDAANDAIRSFLSKAKIPEVPTEMFAQEYQAQTAAFRPYSESQE